MVDLCYWQRKREQKPAAVEGYDPWRRLSSFLRRQSDTCEIRHRAAEVLALSTMQTANEIVRSRKWNGEHRQQQHIQTTINCISKHVQKKNFHLVSKHLQ